MDENLGEMVHGYVVYKTPYRSWLQKMNKGAGDMKSKFKCFPGRSGIMWIVKYVTYGTKLLQSYRVSLISRGAGTADKWEGSKTSVYIQENAILKCRFYM